MILSLALNNLENHNYKSQRKRNLRTIARSGHINLSQSTPRLNSSSLASYQFQMATISHKKLTLNAIKYALNIMVKR